MKISQKPVRNSNLIPNNLYGFLKDSPSVYGFEILSHILIVEIAHQCKQEKESYLVAIWTRLETVIDYWRSEDVPATKCTIKSSPFQR